MFVRKNINFRKICKRREDEERDSRELSAQICMPSTFNKVLHLFIHLASNSIFIDDHVAIRTIREKEENGGDQEISIESEISW